MTQSTKQHPIKSGAPDGSRRLAATSLVEKIYTDVQVRLSSGALAEGERIVIDALAREYGVSAIPVREALNRLASERFLLLEPNRGYRVAAKVGEPEMLHLFQARIVLESGALEHGYMNATPAVIAQLREVNDRLAALFPANDPASHLAFIRANEEFHQILVKLPGNPFLIDAYRRLGYHQRLLQANFSQGVHDGPNIIAEHAALIDALERQDRGAVLDAINTHIGSGSARFGEIHQSI